LGFQYAYRQVLKDLQAKELSDECYEGKLSSAIMSGFEYMEPQWQIQILNDGEDSFEDEEDVEVVDMQFTIGAPIDRRKCK